MDEDVKVDQRSPEWIRGYIYALNWAYILIRWGVDSRVSGKRGAWKAIEEEQMAAERALQARTKSRGKLSDDDVRRIRQLRESGLSFGKIAERFGVSVMMVSDIVKGNRRTSVRQEPGSPER